MGGKTSKSTQTVSIPPEVLARYNAVNARAEEAAGRPFQPYSYDPKDFVAQLTPTQLAGIQNVNYAAGQAQPYFDEATGQLMGAQMSAVPYYAQAGQDISFGQQMGLGFQQQALQDYYYGRQQADPYQQAAGYNIGAAQDIGSQLAQQAYMQQAMAGAMAQPINQQAYADLARAYGSAQPLNQAAVQQYYSGLAAAQPLQNYALSTLGRAGRIGEQISGRALGTLDEGLGFARPIQLENLGRADAVYGAAQPFINRADVQYQQGLGGAQALQQYALQTLGQGQDISQMLSAEALQSLGRGELRAEPLQQLAQGIYGQAYQAAQPFTQAALQQYYGGLGIAGPVQQAALAQISGAPGYAAPFTQAAAQNIAAAQAGVTPYQRYATELGLAGARPVTPGALTGREIQQYMSPYISNVVGQTQALLNQQAEQAQAGQLGSAIRSGAFGGDRAGIAAANLQQQQQLAQGKVLGDLLQSGFGQALGTAQQQQQLALGAEQANRAAQQAASAQLLGVGQAGFGQGMTAAQQQAALAQQLYGQQLGTGQAQAALAQQLFGQQAATGQNIAGLGQLAFGQGLSTGQAQQALAQQLFGQGATTSAQQQAIAESLFGRGATAAAQQAALGAQTFGQNQAVAQGLAALGQQQFGQGMANIAAREATAQNLFGQSAQAAQQQAQIAQNLFSQGATQAAQQAALAQQAFAQNQAVGQNVAQMAQQLFGQGTGTAQAQAAIGAQQFAQQMQQAQQQQALSQLLYGQGMGAAQQQAALGQQLFGQGLAGSQNLSALGQQGFAQQLAAAQARQGVGQGLYGMGAGTAQQLAALGTGAQGAALTGAQAQLAAGQAQQQTAQAGLQALYNQFLQQQAYPFQAAQFLANVAMGTGALSGSTQTAVTPGGLLSDVRMKENIREVGKTFDGQPVYSYNYKGDDKTQMGMLAQEVEQKHPEAVGLAGGMKTVDYDKATRDSVRKPVTIDGEYTASEGGPVSMAHAGERYARGGYANGGSPGLAAPGDMAALLAAQAQMFGPFSGAGMPTGGMPGMPGYVPNAGLPVSELVTPGPMPEAPDAVGQMQKIADIGKTGQEIYQKYKDKQTEKSATDAMNRRPPTPVITSSTRAAADGGAIMPYSQGQNQALNIPTEKMEVKKLETPAMPQGRSAIDDVAAIANIAATVMSMSDSRMKEDIKHIGHTHDGQKIYSYRYKGEPQTHIGLLAQEVEKKHPDAVGNIKGVKTVNYDMATEDAANKAVALARGKADGGPAMPYGSPTSLGIPMQGPSTGKLSVPDMPEGRSVLDDLSQLASIGSDISSIVGQKKPKKASGGAAERDGYQTRGSVLGDFFEGMESFAGAGQGLNPYSGPPGINAQSPAGTSYKRGRPWWERAGLAETKDEKPVNTGLAPPAAPVATDTPGTLTNRPVIKPKPKTLAEERASATPSDTYAPYRGSITGELTPAQIEQQTFSNIAGTPSSFPDMTAGLAKKPAVDAEKIAKDVDSPVEERMRAFMQWVKQPENFIPLATGIAAASAAPTRNTFVALAQGLGAGAQAYLPVKQQQAETRETLARAQQQEVANLRDIANIPAGAMVRDSQGVLIGVRVFGPNNEIIMLPYRDYRQRMAAGESFRFVPSVPGVTTAGTPGQAPMGAAIAPAAPAAGPAVTPSPAPAQVPAPTGQAPSAVQTPARQAPIYEALPEDLRREAVTRAENVMQASPARLMEDPTANPFTDAANVATGARAGRPQRDQLALALSTAGPISGKFAATFSNPLFEYLETGLRSFGFDPGIIRSPELLASEQEIRKITNQMAQSQQAALGGTAFREFLSLMEAIPTTANTPEAQAKLLAGIYVVPQIGIDRDNFFNLMRNEMEQSGGVPADMSMLGGRGLDAEFARRQAPVYIKEKDILSKMFLTPIEVEGGGRTTLMSYLIKNGAEAANDPDMIQLLRNTFPSDTYDAANILRYFGAR